MMADASVLQRSKSHYASSWILASTTILLALGTIYFLSKQLVHVS